LEPVGIGELGESATTSEGSVATAAVDAALIRTVWRFVPSEPPIRVADVGVVEPIEPIEALEAVTVPDTGTGVPEAEPWTVRTPPAGVPAVPEPTTVALRLAAVACVTVEVQVPD